MPSPPLPDTPDPIEIAEHTSHDSGGSGRMGVPGLSSVGRRSKARVSCTWKGCDYQEPDANGMRSVSLFLKSAGDPCCLTFSLENMLPPTDAAPRRAVAGPMLGTKKRRTVMFGPSTRYGPRASCTPLLVVSATCVSGYLLVRTA
jgi:hypothetical protein